MKQKTSISGILSGVLLLVGVILWAAVLVVGPLALLKLCVLFLFA